MALEALDEAQTAPRPLGICPPPPPPSDQLLD